MSATVLLVDDDRAVRAVGRAVERGRVLSLAVAVFADKTRGVDRVRAERVIGMQRRKTAVVAGLVQQSRVARRTKTLWRVGSGIRRRTGCEIARCREIRVHAEEIPRCSRRGAVAHHGLFLEAVSRHSHGV